MTSPVIQARGLGKRYRKGTDPAGKLIEWLRRRPSGEIFWALRDVSFEVRRGEMLGIIGPNGAGKSTLLKLLSRITRPNEGSVEIRGRVGSLLEVGTGFHPELTGRENIYLNGALIGMKRADIRSKFEEIVDYSGVEEFLDTPLKRYSSGMKVRLGFAVALNLRQEIMLVDEVLAVGDVAFREKSLRQMERVTRDGRTVLFVGHNMSMISTACNRAIWLHEGRIRSEGEAAAVVETYQEETIASEAKPTGMISLSGATEPIQDSPLALQYVRLLDEKDREIACLESGQRVKIAIGYQVFDDARVQAVSVALTVHSWGQVALSCCESTCVGEAFDQLPRMGEFVCEFDRLALMPGRYRMAVRCKVGGQIVHDILNVGELRVLEGGFYPTGLLPPPGSGTTLLDHKWTLRDAQEQT